MAGFQVAINGRFWVATEVMSNGPFLNGSNQTPIRNGLSLIGGSPPEMRNASFLIAGSSLQIRNELFLIGGSSLQTRDGLFLLRESETQMRNGLCPDRGKLTPNQEFAIPHWGSQNQMRNELFLMRQNLLLGFRAKNPKPAKQRNYVEVVYEVWFMVLSVAGSEKIRRDPQND